MRIDFKDLTQDARVWIYQNTQAIPSSLIESIQKELYDFTSSWSAHQRPLYAFADIFHERFLVFIVDENRNAATGCSIDSSVMFIRSLEQKYGLQLFDRFTFSYEKDGQIHTVPKAQFAELFRAGDIDLDTLVFDNLIRTKGDFEETWRKPLGNSWLRKFL